MKKTILVVDDDTVMLEALAEYLTLEGYDPVTTHSVAAAKVLIDAVRIDLLLSDVEMQPEDGPSLGRWVQAMHPKEFPIIFMSGLAPVPNYPFLAKPFRLETLKDLIEELLAKSQGQKENGPAA